MSNNLDIFLSYNNNDKEIIKTIADTLSEKGNTVLYKDLDINNDNAWFKEIECFSNSINCIIIFTEENIFTSWQEFEISLFKEKTILGETLNIPVIICGKKIPLNLPSYINNYKFINFDMNKDSIDKLIDDLIKNNSYEKIKASEYKKISKLNKELPKLNNKIWLILSVFLITSWIPLFYFGFYTKNKKWIFSSFFYSIVINISTLFVFITNSNNNTHKIFMSISIISWFICVINTLMVNKEYLIRLKKINKLTKKEYKKLSKKFNFDNKSLFNDKYTKNKIRSAIINSITKEINHNICITAKNNSKEDLKITPILKDINYTINKLKNISKKKNILIYESFSKEIKDYKNNVNEILDNYISCKKFLDKHKYINKEIENIEKNYILYNETEKEYYTKILSVKKSTSKELMEINKTIKDSELKLLYILSCLQNIEAIFEKNKLKKELESDKTEDLNNYVESFKESLNKSINKTSI